MSPTERPWCKAALWTSGLGVSASTLQAVPPLTRTRGFMATNGRAFLGHAARSLAPWWRRSETIATEEIGRIGTNCFACQIQIDLEDPLSDGTRSGFPVPGTRRQIRCACPHRGHGKDQTRPAGLMDGRINAGRWGEAACGTVWGWVLTQQERVLWPIRHVWQGSCNGSEDSISEARRQRASGQERQSTGAPNKTVKQKLAGRPEGPQQRCGGRVGRGGFEGESAFSLSLLGRSGMHPC